jgi:hypothetical protein
MIFEIGVKICRVERAESEPQCLQASGLFGMRCVLMLCVQYTAPDAPRQMSLKAQ